MMAQRQRLTEAQSEMIGDLDDVAEHVAWEFDPQNFEGISTCGFAHIGNIDGRSSFVRRIKSLADSDSDVVMANRRGWHIEVGQQNPQDSLPRESDGRPSGMNLNLMKDGHRGGYRMSLSNVQHYMSGPEYQRMDVRERLHDLVLERLQSHGYLERARRYSRMD